MVILVEKSVYDQSSKDDGFRVLVMQYWPRGVRKEKIDVWYRDLGTSKDLIRDWKAGKLTWAQFKKRYVADLREERKQQLIHQLAQRAKPQKVTLLCGCRDPNRCHRILLREEIMKTK